jgi:hypothetical protein
VKPIKCELKQRIIERTQYDEVEHSVSRSMYEIRGLVMQGNAVSVKSKQYKVL